MKAEIFPTPDTPDDLLLLQTSPLSQQQLFGILTDPLPYREKGGVVMSDTTCLFFNHGWVVKTRQSDVTPDLNEIKSRVAASIKLSKKVKVWHPDKFWFIIRDQGNYWPCNITPVLTPLQPYESARTFKEWRRMLSTFVLTLQKLRLILTNLLTHHVVLDLNPSNYGISDEGRVYYMDDELYYFPSLRDLWHGNQLVIS